MPLVFIFMWAWLVSHPVSGTVSFHQDPPPSSSTQSPAAGADAAQPAPTKNEPPAAEKEASESAAKKPAEGATQSKSTKRGKVRKNASTPAPAGEPRKIVVREGGAIEPPAQIMPGLAPQEADQQRQHAVELLASAEGNLKQLAGRTLDSRQQETVAQVHNYVEGARSALKDGDAQRAHTLALKAQLLADDLVKH